jgi:hypothetical protein
MERFGDLSGTGNTALMYAEAKRLLEFISKVDLREGLRGDRRRCESFRRLGDRRRFATSMQAGPSIMPGHITQLESPFGGGS